MPAPPGLRAVFRLSGGAGLPLVAFLARLPAGLLPTGTYLPTTIPSFTVCNGALSEAWDLRQLFQTAQAVMRRRAPSTTASRRQTDPPSRLRGKTARQPWRSRRAPRDLGSSR